ncbi:hypothetical protein LAZ67_10002324 [Cordylochernes scorpioides]|uniref:PiggyBac transposable element-derived protein domain-containing protein n=1 Tax=Cordylochernes scorpioides TaxID=51811 RepID=A0ABY6KZZ4_9ARAC|nr:hypothetical protein LAZ67_10002324 [Cordylochernes scorpioides]
MNPLYQPSTSKGLGSEVHLDEDIQDILEYLYDSGSEIDDEVKDPDYENSASDELEFEEEEREEIPAKRLRLEVAPVCMLTTCRETSTAAAGSNVAAGTWRKDDPSPPTPPPFTARPGLNLVGDVSSPFDAFSLFFTENIFKSIKEETNRYARSIIDRESKKGPLKPHGMLAKWKAVSVAQIKLFFCVIIDMSLVKKPGMKDYWSTHGFLKNAFCQSINMPRTLFMRILSMLHLNDNSKYIEYGKPGHDRLFKIRPVLESLIYSFGNAYTPQQNLTIDEAMCPFRGRVGFRVYIKGKPHKYGIKIFQICEAVSGYAYNLDIYTGKDPEQPEHNSIPNLVDRLAKRKTMPKTEFSQKLKRGEIIKMRRKHLLAIKWKDVRDVFMLSTVHEGKMMPVKPKTPTREELFKPDAVIDYNKGKDFYLAVGGELLNQASIEHSEKETTSKTDVARLLGKHYCYKIAPESGKAAQRRCKVCADSAKHKTGKVARKDTRFECKQCKIPLCVGECFEKYHTEMNWHFRFDLFSETWHRLHLPLLNQWKHHQLPRNNQSLGEIEILREVKVFRERKGDQQMKSADAAHVRRLFDGEGMFEDGLKGMNLSKSDMAIKSRNHYQGARKWSDTSLNEMLAFIGIIFNMGNHKKNRIKDFWTKERCLRTSWFGEIMTRNRFELLYRFFTTCDSYHMPKYTDPNYDPTMKFNDLIKYMNFKFLFHYKPKQYISIDESLVCLKNKTRIRQYMPGKHHGRFGIKLWMVCESETGYCLQFEPYKGKLGQIHKSLSYDVPMKLLTNSNLLNKGHHIVVDNFFTSIDLARDLAKNGTYLTGTVRANRKGFPAAIKTANYSSNNIIYLRNQEILAIGYKEKPSKPPVRFLSTYCDAISEAKPRRPNSEYPQVKNIYDKYMGGVDLNDMMMYVYMDERKGQKFHRKVVINILHRALLNSYIIYLQHCKDSPLLSRQKFNISVINSLVENIQEPCNPSTSQIQVQSLPQKREMRVKAEVETHAISMSEEHDQHLPVDVYETIIQSPVNFSIMADFVNNIGVTSVGGVQYVPYTPEEGDSHYLSFQNSAYVQDTIHDWGDESGAFSPWFTRWEHRVHRVVPPAVIAAAEMMDAPLRVQFIAALEQQIDGVDQWRCVGERMNFTRESFRAAYRRLVSFIPRPVAAKYPKLLGRCRFDRKGSPAFLVSNEIDVCNVGDERDDIQCNFSDEQFWAPADLTNAQMWTGVALRCDWLTEEVVEEEINRCFEALKQHQAIDVNYSRTPQIRKFSNSETPKFGKCEALKSLDVALKYLEKRTEPEMLASYNTINSLRTMFMREEEALLNNPKKQTTISNFFAKP